MFINMATGHFPSIHGQFILCGCRAVILDRQAIRVRSLLRPSRAFGMRSTLFGYGYLAFRINLLQQLEGCLRESNLTNHARSQLVSYLVNSSIQCRKNSPWDQLVPLNWSQSLNFLMLWAQRGLISWAQYHPHCLEKVQLECSVRSSEFSSFLEPAQV